METVSRIEQAKEVLSAGIAALQSSEAWKQTLATVAEFQKGAIGRYSFRNQVLVMRQSPGAQDVQGFKAWQERGRVVRKGEKALWILAPCVAKAKDEGKAEGEESSGPRVFFKAIPVFAAHQTDRMEGPEGKDMPERPEIARNVEGDAMAGALAKLAGIAPTVVPNVTGVMVRAREPGDMPNAGGWFNPKDGQIVVVAGESELSQQFKTLAHECAHAILHGGGERTDRDVEEVEAESVAFVVSHVMGVDTGCYSFPYVATWGGQKDAIKQITASGERIVKASRAIIEALEGVDA